MKDERDKLDVALVEAYSVFRSLPVIPQPDPEGPDDEVLLALLDGTVQPGERSRIEALVNDAPYCRERLITLCEALAEMDTAPPQPPQAEAAPTAKPKPRSLRLAFAWTSASLRFLWGSLEPRTLVAVPVATRAATATQRQEESAFFDFAHCMGEIQVVIQVELVPDNRIDVQLTFKGAADRLDHLRVNLESRPGGLLDSQPVEDGVARFTALKPCPHEIQIRKASQELARVVLDVQKA